MAPDSALAERELARRLPWLLVFRGVVATVLLLFTAFVDAAGWPLGRAAVYLYAVTVGTYVVVLLLGLSLRRGGSPIVLAAVHLASAVMTALITVHATGGNESVFSFLYLLVILDGAIIGGRRIALVVATACTLTYGLQLVDQLYGIFADIRVSPAAETSYATRFVSHTAAFYFTALLSGHLAQLLQSARHETRSALGDLRFAEKLHEDVLESLPLGVMTFDAARWVLTANAASCRILGTTRERLVGSPVPSSLRRALEEGQRPIEVHIERDGSECTLAVNYSTVSMGVQDGRIDIGVLVLEDRTEVRALERDLQAKQRLASLGQVAAAIAHELRNPLAAISGAVELMGSGSDAAGRAALESVVVREVERLNHMVEEFLLYARPLPPQWERLDFVALVRDVSALLQRDPKCAGHGVALRGPTELAGEADPGQLRQVLWNLLRNAIEASPAGMPVEVRLTEVKDSVVMEIIDRGPGVSPEIREHLFEPFRTTKPTGTGLGLAIVHRIVEAHGGRVDLESPSSGGAVARVSLPRNGIAGPPPTAPSSGL